MARKAGCALGDAKDGSHGAWGRRDREDAEVDGPGPRTRGEARRAGASRRSSQAAALVKADPGRQAAKHRWPGLRGSAALVVTLASLLIVLFEVRASPWSATAGAGYLHYAEHGLSFDYPSEWTVDQVGAELHYETVLAFLGTGSGAEACPSDTVPGTGAGCTDRYELSPGSVVLRVSIQDGPPTTAGLLAEMSKVPGAVTLTIAGQHAVMIPAGPAPGSDRTTLWMIQAPDDPQVAARFEAAFRGPTVSRSFDQVDRLLGTVRFDPAGG